MNSFSNPHKNINHFPIEPGSIVADLGAGNGFYTFLIAKEVGNSGKVYPIDIQQNFVESLVNQATDKGFSNITPIWGDIDELQGTRLRDTSVDTAVLANTLFQLEKPEEAIAEINRILKPNGNVVVLDWTESHGNIGPKPDHVVDEQTAKQLFEKGGFQVQRTIPVGKHHYGFIAQKLPNINQAKKVELTMSDTDKA